MGSTVNLTTGAGDVKVSYWLDPYGQIRKQEGSSVNRQIFTGQEHDEKTGLVYFGARYYDPDTARFITQDSYLGETGTPPSLHRYLYAYSNPTVYVDLYGYDNTAVDLLRNSMRELPPSGTRAGWVPKVMVNETVKTTVKTTVVRGVGRTALIAVGSAAAGPAVDMVFPMPVGVGSERQFSFEEENWRISQHYKNNLRWDFIKQKYTYQPEYPDISTLGSDVSPRLTVENNSGEHIIQTSDGPVTNTGRQVSHHEYAAWLDRQNGLSSGDVDSLDRGIGFDLSGKSNRVPLPGDHDYEGPIPRGSWRLTQDGQGAHLIERANVRNRPELAHYDTPETPRYYPYGSPEAAGQAHIRLHRATKESGIKLRGGNPDLDDEELLDRYREAYSTPDLQGIKGDLRPPGGEPMNDGRNVTPKEAYDVLINYNKQN